MDFATSVLDVGSDFGTEPGYIGVISFLFIFYSFIFSVCAIIHNKIGIRARL